MRFTGHVELRIVTAELLLLKCFEDTFRCFKKCPELFGIFFLPFGDYFVISCSVHFPGCLQHLELKATISRNFEFEPLIFHGICNILVLKLFM